MFILRSSELPTTSRHRSAQRRNYTRILREYNKFPPDPPKIIYEIIYQVLLFTRPKHTLSPPKYLSSTKLAPKIFRNLSLQNSHQKSSLLCFFDFLYCPVYFSHHNPMSWSVLQSYAAFSFRSLYGKSRDSRSGNF